MPMPESSSSAAVRSPRLAGPKRIGLRPGRPLVHRIGISSGERQGLRVTGLPTGLAFDATAGTITGRTSHRGAHKVTVAWEDASGSRSDAISIVVGDTICLTPPVGWNSWNVFGIAVSEADVRRQAIALIETGLADRGFTAVNIDDGWQGDRDGRGRLQANDKFGDLATLCADLNALGLRAGIYSSPGPTTCGGFPGSLGRETQDARSFANWGFDYLKYDWCSAGPIDNSTAVEVIAAPYALMRRALDRVDRDIVYHLCEYGFGDAWTWARDRVGANAWRTTGDIEDSWASVERIGFGQADLAPYAGPGGWNDPDMLVLGHVGGGWYQPMRETHLTPDEQRTHLGLWTILAAPLLLGCDLTTLDAETLALLSNEEVLEVHQDLLGRQARRVFVRGFVEAWRKDLADGSSVIGIFARGEAVTASVEWQELGLRTPAIVRDLWSRRDLDAPVGWEAALPTHGSALLRVWPAHSTGRPLAPAASSDA